MPGIGVVEIIIIAFIGVLLFGAPLLTFFVGYAMGKSRAKLAEPPAVEVKPASDMAPAIEPSATAETAQACAASVVSATRVEDPTDE